MQRVPIPPTEAAPAAPLDLSPALGIGRNDKRMKAMRLLVTGRLRILRVDSNFISAQCKGDSGAMYELLWKDGLWTCSCPARTDCSHLNALWAVVSV